MADFINYLVEIIKGFGYVGIFLATGLEYACFPVSSEILLPFIGYSVYMGQLSLPLAVMASTLGAGFGCSFCYAVGRFGVKLIEGYFYNKFPAIKEGIKNAENYFLSIGRQSVFFGRLMPIVRTYISFPAGMAKMEYSKFLFFSVSGALLWNTVLVGLGYIMGEHWDQISVFFNENKAAIAFIVAVIIFFSFFNKRKKN